MKAKLSNLFVVVNITHLIDFGVAGEFYVMPGESPQTHPSLEAAVECLAQLALEHGHDVSSAPICRLAVVPDEEVQPLLEEALAELKREQEEMFDDDL